MVLAEQFAILGLLAFTGDPLRRLVSTRASFLGNMDFFQIITLDFYLGGFVFYSVALLPFGMFTCMSTFAVLGIAFALFIGLFLKENWRKPKKRVVIDFWKGMKRLPQNQILLGLSLILIFLTVFWLEAEASASVLFGNIHDASLFSLLASVISRNGMIPATLNPFEQSGIIYPQGFSVIVTFASYVLNCGVENIILKLVPLAQALVTLGAYFLGKMWSGKMHHGVILAFMFGFVSRWPKLLVWGSYAFVTAFPLYLLMLGLMLKTGIFEEEKSTSLFELIFLGLLLGYLGAIHAVFFEVIVAAIFAFGILHLFRKRKKAISKLRSLFLTFAVSLIPISVFLYRFLVAAMVPGQNLGLPSDVIAPSLLPLTENLNTLIRFFFWTDWISPYPDLRVMTLILIGTAVIFIAIARKRSRLKQINDFTKIILYSLLGAALVLLVGSKEVGLSFLATAINLPETAIVFYASLIFFVGIAGSLLFDIRYRLLGDHLPKTTSLALVALLLVSISSPFIYYTIAEDAKYCRGIYSLFCVATPEDYELMLNVKNKLPENSTVLISPYDAGGFITSISGYKAIYSFTGSRASVSYSRLCNLICEKNLNDSTYELMRHFNITHIFVGSKAIYTDGINYLGPREWDPLLFLGNPNFKLFDRINNSYLFVFTPSSNHVLFLDDFENENPQ